MLNGINSYGNLTAFERMEQKVLELEKSRNSNPPPPINFFTESDGQSSEDILEKAIQETEKLINTAIRSQEDLKKQLIEQEKTIKMLTQNLSTLKNLKDKLSNNVSNKSTFSKYGQVPSRHLEVEESDVDEELKKLRQELNNK